MEWAYLFQQEGKKKIGLGFKLDWIGDGQADNTCTKMKTHANDAFLDSFRKQSCYRQIHPKFSHLTH